MVTCAAYSDTFTTVHILITMIFQIRRLHARSRILCSTMEGKNMRKLQAEARDLLHTLTQQTARHASQTAANAGKKLGQLQ